MANGTTTPAAGTTSYADYQKKIEEAAARTRQVSGNITPLTNYQPTVNVKAPGGTTTVGGLTGSRQAMYGGLVSSAQAQQEDVKKQAERAASALEMVGASTLSGIQRLESVQSGIQQQVKSSADAFGAAAEKADEYVQAARGRVSEVLTQLDNLNKDIQTNMDFAKAHSMQAGVQAALGSMKDEERNIAQTYGTESKEYAQFQQSKRISLATVQSNIQASYAQLRSQQADSYRNAFVDTATKMNMYIGYQEQQHVEMLKYQEQEKAAMSLQAAQLDATIEQMKMAGMENLANWIVQSPTFTVDVTPMLTALSDLESQEAEAQFKPYRETVLGNQRVVTYL
jgi:hypothetical protein